jgi:hypothetical protein
LSVILTTSPIIAIPLAIDAAMPSMCTVICEVRKMEEMNKIDHESADGHYKQVNEANITKNGRNYEKDRNNDKKNKTLMVHIPMHIDL